jgi:hydrogenase maturation protease
MIQAGNMKVLLIGYGNPGRLDDGLGPALAEAIARQSFENVTVDANYLLTVEDAATVAEHDVVIFADASVNCEEPFTFKPVTPKTTNTFSSHSVEPEMVLGFSRDLFKAKTKGYALAIRGYEFDEFGEKLSSRAQGNLTDAAEFLSGLLKTRNFDQYDR